MSGGLIIRLRPYEKFLINGAIIENGERRAKLRVRSQSVNVLRLRDALHPDEATTPVKRLYFKAQLALSGDSKPEEAAAEIIPALEVLYEALPYDECRTLIDQTKHQVRSHEFYRAMRLLKQLLPYESNLLIFAATKSLDDKVVPRK